LYNAGVRVFVDELEDERQELLESREEIRSLMVACGRGLLAFLLPNALLLVSAFTIAAVWKRPEGQILGPVAVALTLGVLFLGSVLMWDQSRSKSTRWWVSTTCCFDLGLIVAMGLAVSILGYCLEL
jgi:hypothetical protein